MRQSSRRMTSPSTPAWRPKTTSSRCWSRSVESRTSTAWEAIRRVGRGCKKVWAPFACGQLGVKGSCRPAFVLNRPARPWRRLHSRFPPRSRRSRLATSPKVAPPSPARPYPAHARARNRFGARAYARAHLQVGRRSCLGAGPSAQAKHGNRSTTCSPRREREARVICTSYRRVLCFFAVAGELVPEGEPLSPEPGRGDSAARAFQSAAAPRSRTKGHATSRSTTIDTDDSGSTSRANAPG